MKLLEIVRPGLFPAKQDGSISPDLLPYIDGMETAFEEVNVACNLHIEAYDNYLAVENHNSRESEINTKPLRITYFLHAKSFLYALDTFRKFLALLKAEADADATKIQKLLDDFDSHFPLVTDIRNNYHHTEDRMRGITGFGKNKSRIEPQLHNHDGIISFVGILITHSINKKHIGATLSDGSYAEIPISIESVKALRNIFQDVINSLYWISN